jgi:hypothetical protein
MVSNKAIAVFSQAVGQLATIRLSPEEEAKVERLAEELTVLLNAALERDKAK